MNQHTTIKELLEMVFSTVVHAKELQAGQSEE
jgi:stress-induced morphogen